MTSYQNSAWKQDLPFVLVQPAVDTLAHFLSLKRDNVTALLSGQPDVFLIIKVAFEGQLVFLMVPYFIALHHWENAGILPADLWQEPSACLLTFLICDINFKLNLLIDNDSDDLWVLPSLDGLQGV